MFPFQHNYLGHSNQTMYFLSRIICSLIVISGLKSMPNSPESMLLGTHDDITMVDTYKQSTTPPPTAIYCRPISPHPMPLLGYFLHRSLRKGPCGDRTWVADSRVQRLNHWAMKVPEWPICLCLAGLLYYSSLFEIRAPWLGPLSTKAGSFHSQANQGYCCHQCNGPWGDRTWVADSRVQRLNHWAIKVPERPSC